MLQQPICGLRLIVAGGWLDLAILLETVVGVVGGVGDDYELGSAVG